MFKDPVCGKRMNRGKAHAIIEHEGYRYFLCCPRCQTEFEHNLPLYARPEAGQKVKKRFPPLHKH
jgi:YHS domain-containing protein